MLLIQCIEIDILCQQKENSLLLESSQIFSTYSAATLIPGPIVVVKYADLTYTPLATDGFALNTASAKVA